MEYTTTELMTSLNDLEIGLEESRTVRVLFEECDMVKFAKYTPESHRQSLSVQDGKEVVERTRPPLAVEASAGDRPPGEGTSPDPDIDPGAVKAPAKD